MMRSRLTVALVVGVVGCGSKPPAVTESTDTREALLARVAQVGGELDGLSTAPAGPLRKVRDACEGLAKAAVAEKLAVGREATDSVFLLCVRAHRDLELDTKPEALAALVPCTEAAQTVAEAKACFDTALQAENQLLDRVAKHEAERQLAKMFDASSAYFQEEHVERTLSVELGSARSAAAPHKCPHDPDHTGTSGITPPLEVQCHRGPKGRCVPSVDGKDSGSYAIALWNDSHVWNGLNFLQEQPHLFHYAFRWKNETKGYGKCQFTVQAFGDLDGDGIYSTYQRVGKAGPDGVHADEMTRHQEGE